MGCFNRYFVPLIICNISPKYLYINDMERKPHNIKRGSRLDRSAMRIMDLKNQKNDFDYWQTQSYYIRLRTLEEIRQEYITWKYGSQQGFQRVYRIVEFS